jgi:hypothetical protein
MRCGVTRTSPKRLSPTGHSPMAKVQGCVGESTADIRQLAKFREVYWREYSEHSPTGEIPANMLAKLQ